jgi:hypothetical protein
MAAPDLPPANADCGPVKRGVYFLANDGILDLAIAFLNSFRTYNPSIALCLVPFDDAIEKLLQLRERYGFSVWQDEGLLSRCDEIAVRFHGETVGQYRKLSMWEGPFEEFVYIDTDTIVLEDISFVFPLLEQYAFVTSHSNLPGLRKWVWKETILKAGRLTAAQIAFAANTGFVVSRRGRLTLSGVEAKLTDALELLPHMELLCTEQPLLNYLIVSSGLAHTSLLNLRRSGTFLDLPLERWAGVPVGRVERGKIVEPQNDRSLLVHWAGLWQGRERGQVLQRELWEYYRNLDWTAASGEGASMGTAMTPVTSRQCDYRRGLQERSMDRIALSSIVTKSVLSEFQVFKRTFEMFHGDDFQWFIRCDRASEAALSESPNVRCTVFCERVPGLITSGFPRFRRIVSEKMNAMEDAWAAGDCDAVVFLDADLLITAPFLHIAAQLGGDLVLTPRYLPAETEHLGPVHGYFNAGFIFSRSRTFHERWRALFEAQPWKVTDQACLNELAGEFSVRTLSESANIGFWRSAGAWSFAYRPLPADCMFLHVHLLQPLRTRREWVDRTFGLHCLRFLQSSGRHEHEQVLREVLARDTSKWYEASLALAAREE